MIERETVAVPAVTFSTLQLLRAPGRDNTRPIMLKEGISQLDRALCNTMRASLALRWYLYRNRARMTTTDNEIAPVKHVQLW